MKTLYFIDKDKVRHIVCSDVGSWQDAVELIREYLDRWNVKWHYIRAVGHESYHWFDFGSHTEFFELV